MNKLTLNVPEMSCGHCVSVVAGAVREAGYEPEES
jgi:copper chaperone CopZ